MNAMIDGGRLSDIGHANQTVAEAGGFSVVRECVGHASVPGCTSPPMAQNYGEPGKGMKLRPGMVLAVELMINAGSKGTRLMDDQWTVRTADGALSAHVEHSICVTEHGPEIFTLISRSASAPAALVLVRRAVAGACSERRHRQRRRGHDDHRVEVAQDDDDDHRGAAAPRPPPPSLPDATGTQRPPPRRLGEGDGPAILNDPGRLRLGPDRGHGSGATPPRPGSSPTTRPSPPSSPRRVAGLAPGTWSAARGAGQLVLHLQCRRRPHGDRPGAQRAASQASPDAVTEVRFEG